MLKELLHLQLSRKDAEKAGLTEIPITARRIARTKVRLSLLHGHLFLSTFATPNPGCALPCCCFVRSALPYTSTGACLSS
jgi:hypothetical protein